MALYGWKNCPDAVRGQISRLISKLRNRLDKNLLGIYLHGSLAMGSFNPQLSDIDLLVVTREGIIVDTQKGIVEDLLELSKAPSAIEISFVRLDQIKPWKYPTPYIFHYSETWRDRMREDLISGAWRTWNDEPKVDNDLAAHVMMARASGVEIWGQPLESVLPEVPRDDFLDSILSDLKSSRQILESNPVYVILNQCRVLAYLQEGKLFSKGEAGQWALENLPNDLLPVVRSASSVYTGLYDIMYVPEDKVEHFYDRMMKTILELQP